MEFYHILPSNTSPDFFPSNRAEEFSTPIDKPYNLEGKWELGLLDIVHSNYVNTFNNDKMQVSKTRSVKEICEGLKENLKGFTITIPSPAYDSQKDATTLRKILMYNINHEFRDLLFVTTHTKNDFSKLKWNLKTKNYLFQPSPFLRELFNCHQPVFTPHDLIYTNYNSLPSKVKPYAAKDIFINVIPTKDFNPKFLTQTIILKKPGETITPQELLKRAKDNDKSGVMTLQLKSTVHFHLFISDIDGLLCVLNDSLAEVLQLRMAAFEQWSNERYWGHRNFADEKYKDKTWEVQVYNLKDRLTAIDYVDEGTILLEPCYFNNTKNAIDFLNAKIKSKLCRFNYSESTNHVQLEIDSKEVRITLDENLRSILGFSKNAYDGPIKEMATSKFSLTRCIQFLYVYSNIGENIRIGNAEAPLIGIVPFASNNKNPSTNEKNFKKPMYVAINRSHIQQIDVKIYDGAGQLVPFVKDSITSLRLHIRRVIH